MLTGVIPTTWQPQLHALLRVVAGLMFLEHGTSKLLHFPINDALTGMYGQMGGMTTFTGIIELVGGVLIIIGLFTRVTAFVLAGMMAVAYFMAHASQGFFPINNAGELAIMFCFAFLYLAAAGAGPWSLDANRKLA